MFHSCRTSWPPEQCPFSWPRLCGADTPVRDLCAREKRQRQEQRQQTRVSALYTSSMAANPPYNLEMKRVVHAACPHDCPDACGVLITIEDGRATKIQGDPEHPVTRGFLCAKVAKYLDRVYSPDRVLYPMRRVGPNGPRGAGAPARVPFERISWDEA